MGVGADFHGARRLAFIAEGVHVANDGIGQFLLSFHQDIKWTDIGHLVNRRGKRNCRARHFGQSGTPNAAGDDNGLAFDAALVRQHGLD